MDKEKTKRIIQLYERFRATPGYKARREQSCIVPVARDIISATLKNNSLTNEHLTGLIQLLKADCSDDNFEKYLTINIENERERRALSQRAYECGHNGYTGAGLRSIKGLTNNQLATVKAFLLNAFLINDVEHAASLCDGYDSKETPFITKGVYSPWLFYINPKIFPIVNNSHDEFLNWLDTPQVYSSCIRLFQELRIIVDESDLGMIDAFAHRFASDDDIDNDVAGTAEIPAVKFRLTNLNTILYGPPGTGKTFNAIRRSVEIVEKRSFENQNDEAKVIFNKHLRDQIEFVTFHQNYSYEDFVAGLRPDVDAASIGLRFNEHKGIFYKICDRAKSNYKQHISRQTYLEPSFEEVLDVFLEPLEVGDEIEMATSARGAIFHITTNNGKNLSFRKQNGGIGHTLSISTMKAMFEGKREYGLQGVGIYLEPVVQKLKELSKGQRKEIGEIPLKHYVLIIDEINRANISRVFGELITLLESDKRLGMANEIQLRLPGLPDDELFSVPPNLYILGTMNTADKSIALVDIALRRRFVFENVYPRPSLIEKLVPKPYSNFLITLNDTILVEKGPDFLIGHSYMMHEKNELFDFAKVMNHKIIPLLNEYFYNHRNLDILSLLHPAMAHITDYTLEKDYFVGVVCKIRA